MKTAVRLPASFGLLAAFTFSVSSQEFAPRKPFLSAADAKALIALAAKAVEEELSAPAPATKAAKKTQGLAVLIAACAQSAMGQAGGDGPKLAGARDKALSLANAIKLKSYPDARKLAEVLRTLEGLSGKPVAVPLHKSMDRDEVVAVTMQLFASRSRGGLGLASKPMQNVDGLEARIMGISRKPLPPEELAKHAEEIAHVALVSAVLGDLAIQLAPEKDEGKKKRKDWIEWSEQMRDTGVKLVEAARSKDPKSVRAAAAKLNASCVSCHEIYRGE